MSCKVKRLSRKPALKGGNSLPKQFEHNPNIRSNLLISSSPRNQTSTKRSRTIFLKIGLICFRIPSRQSKNFSEFCKVFFSNRFLQHDSTVEPVPVASSSAALKLPSISHTCFFDKTNLYKPLPRFVVYLMRPKSLDLPTEM